MDAKSGLTRYSAPYLVYLASHFAPFSITCLGTGKMPVPQENSFFVERAGEPVLDNGATSEFSWTLFNSHLCPI